MSRRLRRQVTIPEPYQDVGALYRTAVTTKELVEGLAGQRGGTRDVAVTWGDLIDLGLIKPDQAPDELGPHRP